MSTKKFYVPNLLLKKIFLNNFLKQGDKNSFLAPVYCFSFVWYSVYPFQLLKQLGNENNLRCIFEHIYYLNKVLNKVWNSFELSLKFKKIMKKRGTLRLQLRKTFF